MKLQGMICGLILCAALPVTSQADSAPVSNTAVAMRSHLTVRVTGIKNDNGVIRIALFNNPQTYEEKNPNASDAYSRARLPIKHGEAVWQVDNLPYGVYGIKLFHDENNSGLLKKNFIGRPTEGVGFSSNPALGNHAPTFDEVKFTVGEPEAKIEIKMINPK